MFYFYFSLMRDSLKQQQQTKKQKNGVLRDRSPPPTPRLCHPVIFLLPVREHAPARGKQRGPNLHQRFYRFPARGPEDQKGRPLPV